MSDLKIFIIAGEASGDLLGGKLANELKENAKGNISLFGIGGTHLQKAGLNSIFPMSDLSIMGFVEVIPKIPAIFKRIRQTKKAIEQIKPDIVITIDSPDFCFRVIKKINKKKLINTKFVHYVAPTVWAYREKRSEQVAKLYDLLLVILPFEPDYFTRHNLRTAFVGHPIFSAHNQKLINPREFNPDNKKYLVITTGSRRVEVLMLLPIFKKVAMWLSEDFPDMQFLFPTSENLKSLLVRELEGKLKNYKILLTTEEKEEALEKADYALAKSGTNTMENAFYNICQVICYKVNSVTYNIAKRIVKTKFVNLINITMGREVIPELIQKHCNAEEVYYNIKYLMIDDEASVKQVKEVQKALVKFSNSRDLKPALFAAQEILEISQANER